MARIVAIAAGLGLLLAGITTSGRQPGAPQPPAFDSVSQRHSWVLTTLLPWMEQFQERYHNVPRSDGEFLRWLIVTTQRKKGLEIGTANGYSAIWLGLGLEETGGHLTTIEIQPDRVREAKENLKRAGLLDRIVSVVEGDALKVVPKLEGTFDFAFIDVGPAAAAFVDAVVPKLAPQSLLVAHRPPFPGALRDYLDKVGRRSNWLTTVIQTGAPTALILTYVRD
ncbi:MAG: class I SAM-dependent methyltransferase [Armatimonadetes bacterium]|nr:class I SAM-dependent methyltransferase [Armatimonadota bacterium]MDW8121258.1 class I SAM-dependent methyltransferase [Armatimonadota bacterium]